VHRSHHCALVALKPPSSGSGPPSGGDTLALLTASQAGDASASTALFDAVYGELRRLARRSRHGGASETLNTTALVHEAYLKIVDRTKVSFEDRGHLLGVAAKAMRHVLVDYARAQNAQKRGGGIRPELLRETLVGEAPPEEVLALDEALKQLAVAAPRQARIVECRFFGGLTAAETAAALGVSEATVHRGWRMARARLFQSLREDV
ncbi:MAG: ECF-type sigma factor, partial [Bacteroidota bacterium]